jgi:uncharacterized membrane protein YcjF (UPF0283 family)
MPEPESAPGPLREHDTGLGRPIQVASQVDELTEDDQRLLAEEADRQAQDDLAKAEELLASKPDYGWWGFLTSPAAFTFLIGIVGLVGLYLTAQTLSILNSLQAQPAWVQVVCICIMVLCAVAVVLAMVRFTGVFFRLRANQQVRLSGIRELEQRTQLRWVARAQSQSARERLEQYLRDYPLQTEAERKRLRALGCSDEQLTRLIAVREELLDANRFVSTAAWFDRFSAEFQAPIDAVASQRVVFWAKRAGITTAVAPNALVDSSAVLFCGFHMMTDLCQLYALRAGPTGTAIILGRVFFHSYLAGQLNDWEKLTEEQLNHLVSPHGPLYEAFAARALTKIGAKATSGLLNYFLMQRLGKFACRLLRPVA